MRQRSRFVPALAALAVLGVVAAPLREAGAEERPADAEREAFLNEKRAFMIGVGAWSAINLAGGALLLTTDVGGRPNDPKSRAFRRSFASIALAYGLINGALAAGTIAAIPRDREKLTTPSALYFQRRQSAYVLAINVGLDMFYTGVGAWLWATGPTAAARGTGAGFVTQGGFLTVYDAIGAALYRY